MVQQAYVQGISTRSADDLIQAMGMTGISKSQVSRLCTGIDDKVQTFLNRPLEDDWPHLWLDATYVKVRQDGRMVSVAVIVARGVNNDGRLRTAHDEPLRIAGAKNSASTGWAGSLHCSTMSMRECRRRRSMRSGGTPHQDRPD